jgi:anti-anti-sigma regulatory factor
MDFSGVKFVDSMGLGVIIAEKNPFEKTGGKLSLINVPEEY